MEGMGGAGYHLVTCKLRGPPPDLHYLAACGHWTFETRPDELEAVIVVESRGDTEYVV